MRKIFIGLLIFGLCSSITFAGEDKKQEIKIEQTSISTPIPLKIIQIVINTLKKAYSKEMIAKLQERGDLIIRSWSPQYGEYYFKVGEFLREENNHAIVFNAEMIIEREGHPLKNNPTPKGKFIIKIPKATDYRGWDLIESQHFLKKEEFEMVKAHENNDVKEFVAVTQQVVYEPSQETLESTFAYNLLKQKIFIEFSPQLKSTMIFLDEEKAQEQE